MLATVSGSAFNYFSFGTSSGDWLTFAYFDGASDVFNVNTSSTSLFRDVSAWYHIVLYVDTTQATAANRVKIYVNNVEQTLGGTYPTQNYDTPINNSISNLIGGATGSYTAYLADQYMTEINFIDGQALTPSSFGSTNAQTGVWQPKAYSGSYGTNGFYLNFSDNSNTTAATLGKDYSGNGNNWTPNNFSVTAGAGNDSLVDVPTSYGLIDTGGGGEVRGNYATLNALNLGNNATLVNGNLDHASTTGAWTTALSTIGMRTGKWYFEATMTSSGEHMVGIANESFTTSTYLGANPNSWAYYSSGNKWNGGADGSYGVSYTNGDVIGAALDMDGGTITFYKNNTSQGTAYTGLTGTMFFGVSCISTTTLVVNFGQRPFAYTAPSGFKALCTQNLPTPTIGATSATQAGKYFNTVLYTGNGATQTISGVGFQPDFVWAKSRSDAYYHTLLDVVRGRASMLFTNGTFAEYTTSPSDKELTAFTSDGFSLGPDLNYSINSSAKTFVAWNWKAGSSTVTNTAGSLTSQVNANPTAGFSVLTYSGNAAAEQTIGHGLGAVPKMIIVKGRTGGNWPVYHSSVGRDQYAFLNDTAAVNTVTGYWGSSGPTTTTFGVVGGGYGNNSGTAVAYCFAEVPGYSRIGSYTGNGSSTGPFVHTGMRPAFLMIKNASNPYTDWYILDAVRNTYNAAGLVLRPNTTTAEQDYTPNVDFLSNGFKIRDGGAPWNGGGELIIFMAFAQTPFKYAIGR
jgi:hypothetical protein